MNIIELAEQAGLAYKTPNGKYWIDAGYPDIHLERFAELVAAAALAQPEQEPVAWVDKIWTERPDLAKEIQMNRLFSRCQLQDNQIPLYTAPPRKPWQSLTDEEIMEPWPFETRIELVRWIEAALRSKNDPTSN